MKNYQSMWKTTQGSNPAVRTSCDLLADFSNMASFCSQIRGTTMFPNTANHSFHQSQELWADCSAGIFTYKTKHAKELGLVNTIDKWKQQMYPHKELH